MLLLQVASALSVFAPLFAFIRDFKTLWPRYGAMFLYLAIAATTESVGLLTMHRPGGNLALYNAYSIIECFLIARVFSPAITDLGIRLVVNTVVVGFCLYAGYRFRLAGEQMDTIIWHGDALLNCFSATLFVLDAIQHKRLSKDLPRTFFAGACLIFFPCALLAFFFGDYLIYRPAQLASIWHAVWLMNMSYHCFITAGILTIHHRDQEE